MNRQELARELLMLAKDLVGDTSKVAARDIVMISDLNSWTGYFIDNARQAKSRVDRSAAEEAFKLGDTITMGKVIATPFALLSQKDKANFRKYGIGKEFEV